MKCDDARQRLSWLLDGELPVPQEADLRNHLDDCTPCREYHARLKSADARLADAAQQMAPVLDADAARRFASGAVAAGRRSSLLWRGLAVIGSIAALVLVGLGIIALDVNYQTAEPQEVRLFGGTLIDGAPSQQRVNVRHGATGRPIAGAHVTAFLKTDAMATALKLLEIDTDANGDAIIPIDSQSASEIALEIRVTSPAGQDRIERRLSVARPRRIHISTDKPIYQPTQIVHVAVKAVNSFTMRPVTGDELAIVITDPAGNKIFRQAKPTSDFGIVGVDFQLADEVTFGRYSLKAKLGAVESERTFEVQRYVLPKFGITLDLNRSFARPGEPLSGQLTARYFGGMKPVKGTVRITGSAWEVDKFVEKIAPVTGETGEDGRFAFMTMTPREFFGTPLERGDATFRIEASVTDGADHTETKAAIVTISKDPLRVVTIPDGGFAAGVENRAYIVVSRPDGSPVKATLMLPHGTFETDDAGVALIRIPSLAHAYDIDVRARDGAFLKTVFDPRSMAKEDRAFAIFVRQPVLRGGAPLEIDIVSAFPTGTLYLDVVREGHTLLTKAIDVKDNAAAFATDLPPDAVGTVSLHAYRILPDGNIERDSRLILVEPPQGLKMKLTPSKAEYRPGEEMPVVIEVTDSNGKPLDVAFTIGVVDAAVFALHESRPGLERVYLAIEEDLLKSRYQLKNYAAIFDDPRGATELAPIQPPGSPLLEAVTFAGKTVYFKQRAARFNLWLQNILVGALALTLLLGFLGLIGWSILVVHRRHGAGSAAGCGVTWVLGLLALGLLVMAGGAKLAYDRSEMAPTGMAPRESPIRSGDPIAAASGPRIRQYFPETLFWKAEVITDANGRANLTLPAADSITTWKVNASGISRSGRMGAMTADLRVFQDFYVDLDLPVSLTQGDVIHIPVAVYNYKAEAQTIRLELDAPGFELRDAATQQVTIAANDVKAVYYRVRAEKFGVRELTVKAFGSVEDAVRRTVEVLPDGKEIPLSYSDRVLGRRAFNVVLPANAIDGASAMWVKLYPSTFSEIVTGLEQLVRLPHG